MNTEHTAFIDQSDLVSLVSSTVSWAQLQPGKFDVAYQVVQSGPLIISSRSMNLAFHGQAKIERDRRSLTAIETRTGARWCGLPFDPGSVAVCADELDVRTTGPSTLLTVAVDQHELQRRFPDSLDAADLADRLACSKVMKNPNTAAHLRRTIKSFCTHRPTVPPTANGTLIPLLIALLDESDDHSVERSNCLTRRYAAVRACEAYMREHIDSTVTLLDLSRACGMRSRSLINAFEAITGFSPMDYLKRLRLSAVRNALLRADTRSTRVIDVATDWGFWHMGHFAHDYRGMFGEAPSETLLHS